MSGKPTAAETIPGYAKMLDDLTAMLAAVVPCPIFASSAIFPSDGAWHFRDGKQEFFCASPLWWKNLPAETRGVFTPGYSMPLSSIEIVDIDNLEANEDVREKVMNALLAALASTTANQGDG